MESAYYELREKGIVLSFFDSAYVDTEVVGIGPDPDESSARILNSLIALYFKSMLE